jgi:hypothetical protein
MGESDKTKRWRSRAEHLRSIASTAEDAEAKRNLLRLARDWERMADRNDQSERPPPSPNPARRSPARPGKKGETQP